MACETLLNTGRTLVVSISLSSDCESTPLTTATTPISDWEPIGSVQSTNENINERTTTANTDSESLTLMETLGLDFELTLTALDVADVASVSTQQAIRDAIVDAGISIPPTSVKKWVRVWDKALSQYRYYYVHCAAPSRSGEVEGNRTAEFTFTAVPTGKPDNKPFQKETIL